MEPDSELDVYEYFLPEQARPIRRLDQWLKENFTPYFQINTGKRTEWSPIRSVIIRVITKSKSTYQLS